MTTLSDIERAYETKYSHDLEVDFKAIMRRNRLLGLWAAEQMGITGGDAEAYAKQVIEADFEAVGHEAVAEKVLQDLTNKGVDTSAHIIERMMEDFLLKAREEMAQD